jgi:hypothetical protein
MRTVLAGLFLIAAVWSARPARADDTQLPAFGPTSIAVPADWATGKRPRQLVRSGSRPIPAPRAPSYSRGGYEISRDPWHPRGPLEIRDEWLLAQPRMTLPAVSPDPIPRGEWRVHLHVDRGNDFGWDQSGPTENPIDRRFIVDGEHQTTELDVRYGLRDKLSLGIRVPIQWRGGGFMDGPIDWFHDATKGLGFLDNGRPFFDKDRYRVNGRDDAGNAISWDDKRGTALGNIELSAHWNFLRPGCRTDWRAAWVVRVGLPTGGDPYDSGFDLGTQLVVAKSLASRLDVYAGLGGTWFGDTELDGVQYRPFRFHAFLAAEYAFAQSASLIVETNAASRLVTNLANYPAPSWYVNVEVRVDLTSRFEWEIGFTENLIDQQGTIDFGGFTGVTMRL